MSVRANDPKWWPAFRLLRLRSTDLVACSVCGAAVADTATDRGRHQLFHGWLWRLLAGDHPVINDENMEELRAWLRAVNEAAS